MADSIIDDDLWDEFHRVVNMTSRQLREWLAVEAAGEATEGLPDQDGPPVGHQVLKMLGKRRADLTPDDVAVMEKVVRKVMAQRRDDLEPTAGQDAWRRKLMDLGHDPLQPPRT